MSSDPVIYGYPPSCRTDERGSMTCARRPRWEIRTAAPWFTDSPLDTEWLDYVCSRHLVAFLDTFTIRGPVAVDRVGRQGARVALTTPDPRR
jgi:hypothetical protein